MVGKPGLGGRGQSALSRHRSHSKFLLQFSAASRRFKGTPKNSGFRRSASLLALWQTARASSLPTVNRSALKEFVGRGGLPRDEIASSFRTFMLAACRPSFSTLLNKTAWPFWPDQPVLVCSRVLRPPPIEFSVFRCEPCFCPPPPLPWVDSGLFERRKGRKPFRLAACRERPVAQHPKTFSYDATPASKSDRLLAGRF